MCGTLVGLTLFARFWTSETQRYFVEIARPHRLVESVVGSLVVAVLCCGAWSVSYPQAHWQATHGCTGGIDRDPLTSSPPFSPCDAPFREDDGNIRAPALTSVLAVCVCGLVYESKGGGCTLTL